MELDFRPVTRQSLKLLVNWLAKPHVQKWWREPATLESVEEKYGGRIQGNDPTSVYIIFTGQTAIGMIQSYYVDDYPEHTKSIKLDNAVGVDLFIGEEDFIGKGYGPAILSKFINDVIPHEYQKAECVVADPEVINKASIRSFEKAGFKKGNITDGEHGPEQLMVYQIKPQHN